MTDSEFIRTEAPKLGHTAADAWSIEGARWNEGIRTSPLIDVLRAERDARENYSGPDTIQAAKLSLRGDA